MEFDDADLLAIVTAQRNNAMSESAQAQAVIARLQKDLKARDEKIAALEAKKGKRRGNL